MRAEPESLQPMPRYSGRDAEDSNEWSAGPQNWQPHLCFPPKVYPSTHRAAGSEWRCPNSICHQVWEAVGVRVIGAWPQGISRNDVMLGPEYWLPLGEIKGDVEQLMKEAQMYDFRHPLELILEELKKR